MSDDVIYLGLIILGLVFGWGVLGPIGVELLDKYRPGWWR